MNKRRHIGPAHSPYPAQVIGEKIGFWLFKLVAAIASVAIWSICYYIILNVVVTIAGGGSEEEGAPTVEKYLAHPVGKWLWIGIGIVVFISVLRSKIGARNKRDPKKERRLV